MSGNLQIFCAVVAGSFANTAHTTAEELTKAYDKAMEAWNRGAIDCRKKESDMELKLNPCGCRGKVVYKQATPNGGRFQCECGAAGPSKSTKELAAEAWNTDRPLQPTTEQILGQPIAGPITPPPPIQVEPAPGVADLAGVLQPRDIEKEARELWEHIYSHTLYALITNPILKPGASFKDTSDQCSAQADAALAAYLERWGEKP